MQTRFRIGSGYRCQLFDDPQVLDDPQLFDDQLEVWTLINQKSTVIPPSLMVLFNIVSVLNFFSSNFLTPFV